jgi:tetratricopeptide (TPR) repeat protein
VTPADGGSRPGGGTRARAARLTQTPEPSAKSTRSTRTSTSNRASEPGATPGGSKDQPTTAAPDAARQAALAEERDFLLGSLRDLEAEHDAGDVDDADYAALVDDYTARAAGAIRAMEAEPSRRPPTPEPERSMTRRILVGALVVIFSLGAGVLVAQWSGQRSSGDTITGGIRGNTRDDLLQARQQSANGQYLDAIKSYDKALQLDPANTEALAYKGWMLRIVSTSASGAQRSQLQAESLASLQQALRTSPTDGTSLVFMAVLLGDLGKPQAALDELAKVPAGQLPSFMSGTIDQFRAQMQAQLAGRSTTSTTTTTG